MAMSISRPAGSPTPVAPTSGAPAQATASPGAQQRAEWIRDRYDQTKSYTTYETRYDYDDHEWKTEPVTHTIPRDKQLDRREFGINRFIQIDAINDRNDFISIGELEKAIDQLSPETRAEMERTVNEQEKVQNGATLKAFLGIGGGVALGVGAFFAAASIPALAVGLGVVAAGAAIYGIVQTVKGFNASGKIYDALNRAFDTLPGN